MPPPPDASLAGEDFCYITTTGRVTGKPHTIEIWFALHQGVLYILTAENGRSDTVSNLKKHPEVTINLREATYDATGRPVTEPGEDALARRLVLDKYAPDYKGDLTAWARTALPVAFDFH